MSEEEEEGEEVLLLREVILCRCGGELFQATFSQFVGSLDWMQTKLSSYNFIEASPLINLDLPCRNKRYFSTSDKFLALYMQYNVGEFTSFQV